MKIRSAKIVCFSPTGTTRRVVESIARGIDQQVVDLIDVTKPDARTSALRLGDDELLVVAVPVYIGRVPALLTGWLRMIQARNTPTVCVVVYGNRAYDDALVELEDILVERGCIPIASAAYVGEHSFSSPTTPTAAGRPDAADLAHAESFGRSVAHRLRSVSSLAEVAGVNVPGNRPYRGDAKLWTVDFIAVGAACTQCGTCAESCPVGAIPSGNSASIDREKCITCCACLKRCPQGARTMKPGPVRDAAVRLNTLYRERKEPVSFL